MSSAFLVCVLMSELPLDGPLLGVSGSLPHVDLALQKLLVGDATVQAHGCGR
jgi:hypothetical protein